MRDPQYTKRNQAFVVAADAPFTDGPQMLTFNNLDIHLQPNKYYRLTTVQDYQNRSVILASTHATGTAMWNEFIYGTGRVEHTYSFYPYLSWVMIPHQPLFPPHAVDAPSFTFDSNQATVNAAWPPAIDVVCASTNAA